MLRIAALAAVVAVLAIPRPVEAEMWISSLHDLLQSATTIEIVKLDGPAGSDGKTRGHVAEVIRSIAAVGDPVALELGELIAPAAGDRVLVICDDNLCPRAAAIDRDGVFVLSARELGDSGVVMPNVLLRRSIEPALARQPVPDLCLSALISLADEPGVTDIAVTINAMNGTGTATVDGQPVSARLWPRFGRGLGLQIGDLELAGLGVRGDRGCLKGPFVPIGPVPRRRASLLRALTARPSAASVFARGVLTIGGGRAVPAGSYPLELSLDPDGRTRLASKLVTAPAASSATADGLVTYEFPVGSSSYPSLRLTLPAGMRELATRRTFTAKAVWVRDHDAMPLGELALAYVPE